MPIFTIFDFSATEPLRGLFLGQKGLLLARRSILVPARWNHRSDFEKNGETKW